MKTALVTGSAGFVGRHLVPKLHAAGYLVTCVDPNQEQYPCSGSYFKRTAESFIESYGYVEHCFDVIVHLGANILDVDARSKQGLSAYDDIALDLAVCKYVESHPPKEAFIAMSSCAVDFPADPYCIVKRNLEVFADALYKKGVPVVILRPFSGYDATQAESYPFPAILGRAQRKEDPLVVWGGTQVRDWVHIDDLTDAIMHGVRGNFPENTPIEIGTGRGVAFFKLASKMADAVGYKPRVTGDQTKATSSRSRVADTSLAASFGWTAKITLEEGIERATVRLG